MKTLVLIRHAKSSWDHPDLDDFERPLNKRGRRDAPFMGNLLKEKKFSPDLIIASPAVRASDTSRIIADALSYPQSRIQFDESIYEADVSNLSVIIRETQNAVQRLILVGHNPSISFLANLVTPNSASHLPTCAVHWTELGITTWKDFTAGCGRLVHFEYPKKYRISG
ncbi:MAG: histidine phosphatase family protein [Calditrichales bacterium]|nr:MAG: histidine phosphatase family protein [Calditrichales bacterium]